jgi:tripartite-type tricarboxylate transporter receptor subunit TctC
MISKRDFLLQSLAGAGMLSGAMPASGADYPTKPIRVIVPFQASSLSDAIARSVTNLMATDLGVPFVVDARPGGNTFIGMIAAASAPPDGYTLALTTSAVDVLQPLLYSKMPYDPAKLNPLAILASSPYVLVVPPQLKVNSVAELVQMLKARPGAYNFGSAGIGTGIHLLGEKFAKDVGVKMEHVQFLGSAPAQLALIRGDIQVYFDVLTSSLPLVRDGRLKALAVGTNTRFPGLPDVPTMAEAGFSGYDMTAWYGLRIPRGTPAAAVEILTRSINKSLANHALREQYAGMGMLIASSARPEEMRERIAVDQKQWGVIVKGQKISLD